jgi:carboxymethylenebutenolidase
MKRRDEQTEARGESGAAVSRRKFLESTATAGGAVLASAAVGCAAQNENKTASSNNGGAMPSTAQLTGVMTEYPSETIKIPAYLSRPKKKGAVPGAVLVIHEVFGLNDHIKSIADRISAEGYLALAPDLFVRAADPPPPSDSNDMAAIRKAASSIPTEVAVKDMQAALDYMKSIDGVRRHFASIGFCMGGGFSYQLATHTKDLLGAVIFYGRTPLELVPQVSCPLLRSFGALDTGIPPEKVKEFEDALSKAGKKADIKVYPGAGHGFFNDTRAASYNAEAAADAWQRTKKFFRERLGA